LERWGIKCAAVLWLIILEVNVTFPYEKIITYGDSLPSRTLRREMYTSDSIVHGGR
jgi:hypothetical protein